MSQRKLLLCTDMDRTVIPNGVQSEHPDARKRFRAFCEQPEVTVVYVTGRHQSLVKQAIKNYQLPMPDYAITDVGTKIYQIVNGRWRQLDSWEQEIDRSWNGKSHEEIKQILSNISELSLQESSKQNTHKLSYYLPLYMNKDVIIAAMETQLKQHGVMASLIWSIDEPKNIGLLDVLPVNATKLHAIEFLQQQLAYDQNHIIFAGDSGNDLPVLTSSIQSVLVDNASDDIKSMARQVVQQNGHADSLYIAKADALEMNGNYSAGVLEGVWHFAPDFRELLQRT